MVAENIKALKQELVNYDFTLVSVTKTKPIPLLQEAYNCGERDFGENKVQDLVEKEALLPKDINWHMIGHLQSNKVKYIAPFVHLIHGVDSEKLLKEINKQAGKNNRIISILLQVHIAQENTKFGFSIQEAHNFLESDFESQFPNIRILGLMGMASNSTNEPQVTNEFNTLKALYDRFNIEKEFTYLSMGMSGDYKLALEAGSNMIRVGSLIFGKRV